LRKAKRILALCFLYQFSIKKATLPFQQVAMIVGIGPFDHILSWMSDQDKYLRDWVSRCWDLAALVAEVMNKSQQCEGIKFVKWSFY
jgi:hypothetical protein